MKHRKVVDREFSKQAARFGEKGLTLSSQDILDWIVNLLPLQREARVLDVAAGTGIFSRAIAPHVKDVFAIDLTPQMLFHAHQETTTSKLENIWFEEGNAEQLPFPFDCFDLVVARLAIHHFEQPILPLREMVRVCKLNGQVGIIDLLSPENSAIAEIYNELEQLRDPSHVVALSRTQMESLLLEAGISLEHVETRDVEVDFQKWVQMTEAKPDVVQVIEEKLVSDIHHGTKTGMRPFTKNGNLKFLQVWSVMIGTKSLEQAARAKLSV